MLLLKFLMEPKKDVMSATYDFMSDSMAEFVPKAKAALIPSEHFGTLMYYIMMIFVIFIVCCMVGICLCTGCWVLKNYCPVNITII